MKRHTLATLAFAVATLFAIPALSHAQVTCTLHGATPSCTGSSPGVSLTAVAPDPGPFGAACSAGAWWQAYFTVDLNPALAPGGLPRTAYMTVEYEGTPWGWTVDVGDSPTNNGYGGNSGGPEHATEIQVVNQLLSVYNDPGIPGQVDNPMLSQQLSLTNGSLKIDAADQALAVGQPRSILATPVTKTLFQIPDPNIPTSPARWSIYAGFNHVIDRNTNRYGCGVRSVTIWTGTGGV